MSENEIVKNLAELMTIEATIEQQQRRAREICDAIQNAEIQINTDVEDIRGYVHAVCKNQGISRYEVYRHMED